MYFPVGQMHRSFRFAPLSVRMTLEYLREHRGWPPRPLVGCRPNEHESVGILSPPHIPVQRKCLRIFLHVKQLSGSNSIDTGMHIMTQATQTELRLASRMSRLGTETAFEVLVKARALEKQGRDIVHLEIGEPDFDTPPHIIEAASGRPASRLHALRALGGLARAAAGHCR